VTQALDAELDLLDLDRWTREGPPFAAFARLREDAPVYWHSARGANPGFWVVTGYDEVVTLGRRTDALSSDEDNGGVTGLGPGDEIQGALDRFLDRLGRWGSYGLSGRLGRAAGTLRDEAKQLLTMDPPEHTTFRRMVHRSFTPRMVSELRPKVEAMVRAALDRVGSNEPFDLVTELAMPVPLHVIADMLGVPPEEHRLINDWSNRMMGGTDPEYRVGARSELTAMVEFARYVEELRVRAREHVEGGIVSVLLDARHDGQELNPIRFTMFVFLLVIAGNETTRNAISHGVLELARHPDQFQRLVESPDLIPTAVEEILRWASPVMYFRRNVMAEVEIGGRTLRPGDIVSLWYIAANRCPDIFEDPDRFDVARSPNPHIAFGGGGHHYCLGASLARLEIEVVLDELIQRTDGIDLFGEPNRLRSNFLNGIKHLPVALRAPTRRGSATPAS
jgi:cholest-4-en-3-one 26-monooxygenase